MIENPSISYEAPNARKSWIEFSAKLRKFAELNAIEHDSIFNDPFQQISTIETYSSVRFSLPHKPMVKLNNKFDTVAMRSDVNPENSSLMEMRVGNKNIWREF